MNNFDKSFLNFSRLMEQLRLDCIKFGTITEVAEWTGLSYYTVYYFINGGRNPFDLRLETLMKLHYIYLTAEEVEREIARREGGFDFEDFN